MPLHTIVVNQGDYLECGEGEDGRGGETEVPPPTDQKTMTTANTALTLTAPKEHEPDFSFNCQEDGCDDLGEVASNKGWGIPSGSGLRGGGLNSLNNGTSGWGAPPAGPNPAATGWGAPPGAGAPPPQGVGDPGMPGNIPPTGPSSGGGPPSSSSSSGPQTSNNNQWASNSPNRNNASQNQNGQPNISGSQLNNGGSGVGVGGNGGSAGVGVSSSWAQAAGKSLQSNPSASSTASASGAASGSGGSGPPGVQGQGPPSTSVSSSVTSKQIEQLNSMRDALFSHDGWGGQNVNQDSNWDIPGSPEPGHKDLGGGQMATTGGPANALWKPNVNNGTELWEANLRNGGAPPPPPTVQKAPWGHTPTSNIGGTWGEEDDSGESSNVWSGPAGGNGGSGPVQGQGPSGNAPASGSNWGMGGGGGMNNGPGGPPNREPGNGMWNAPMKKEGNDWGGGRPDAGMGGPGGRGPMGGPEMGGNVRGGWGVPEDTRREVNPGGGGGGGMWNKPPGQGPPPHQQPPQGNPGWGGPPQGPVGGMGNKDKGPGSSGWDDVSPPTQRRPVPNIPNYDDGTALWGAPLPGSQQGGQAGQPPGGRMPPAGMRMPNKMDENPVGWGANRSNGWPGPDGPAGVGGDQGYNGGRGGGGWEENKNMSWGEAPGMAPNTNAGWGKPKTPTTPGWGEDGMADTAGWSGQSKSAMSSGTPSSRYMNGGVGSPHSGVHGWGSGRDSTPSSSRPQFNNKPISDLKDDIELVLRASNMNLSDAIDSLDGRGGPPMDAPLWGNSGPMPRGHRPGGPGHGDHDYDLGLGMGPGGPMGGMGPPPGGPAHSRFGVPNPRASASGLMNNVGVGGAPNLAGVNPTLVQRILNQQQQPGNNPQQRGVGPAGGSGGGAFPPDKIPFPFNKNVSAFVNQIQMAVQAGYLSNQLLQHSLPPQSLVTLNQLLQHVKNFQMLTQAQQQMGNPNSPAALQLSVQITKTKQTIQNLHNQIAAQQAHHAKQQQQQQPPHGGHQGSEYGGFKPPMDVQGGGRGGASGGGGFGVDPFATDFNFPSGGNKEVSQQGQSRLSQWTTTKMGSMEKDEDFSRAPGGANNGAPLPPKTTSSLILGPSDNTWSTSVSSRGDGWPSDVGVGGSGPGGDDMKTDGWQTDLVPEFEPGKPWKGAKNLNVEDDPTLTPGSVVKSPLALGMIKDAAEIFAKSTSSVVSSIPDSLPMSLNSSNTWSFTPTSTNTTMPNSMAKLNSTRELWGDFSNPAQQGSRPPPGLQQKKPTGPNPGNGNSCCWLLLRNLTPQIDGSTLRTLCVQHGPLQKFHLGLNHGICLVRYNSREEAAKAQNALNNCVLGNTTILAEAADDASVQGLLHSLSANAPPPANNSGFGSSAGRGDENPWGHRDNSPLWSSGPWGSSGLDAPDRATPSSLNSLLPDGLLGGESA